MQNNLLAWGVALSACMPLPATSQAADTESPRAAAQLTYQSAFADYKPYKDAEPANWRVLNDTVAGVSDGASGHAGHGMGGMGGMKGMEMPAMPAASASAPMQMKTTPNHDGHHKHGGKP
jgi:hypothetical protein